MATREPGGGTAPASGGAEASGAAGAREPLAVYADLRYRDVFWAERPYEDASDRAALLALLPTSGHRLLDVGAGYGRLVDEYAAFDEIVLLDASDVHVGAARERFDGDPRISVIRAEATSIPLGDASVDVVVCVRVLHHLADPRPALAEMARVLKPGGVLVLEVANKRNAKAVARWLLGRQDWSPFAPGPVSYRPLHHDHAPADVDRWLESAGLRVGRSLTVSLFRLRALTTRVDPTTLVRIERPLQRLLAPLAPGPSRFVRARRLGREVNPARS